MWFVWGVGVAVLGFGWGGFGVGCGLGLVVLAGCVLEFEGCVLVGFVWGGCFGVYFGILCSRGVCCSMMFCRVVAFDIWVVGWWFWVVGLGCVGVVFVLFWVWVFGFAFGVGWLILGLGCWVCLGL